MNTLLLVAALKVLMIGNSFSVQMQKAMPPIARNMGLELDICSLYIGGCSLERHWNNYCAPTSTPYSIAADYRGNDDVMTTVLRGATRLEAWERNGKRGVRNCTNIPQTLVADKWDVVTVQQASHESWQPASYEPCGGNLIEAIRRDAPSAKVYVHETWSYTPWDKRLKKWNITPVEMYGALHSAYARFATTHKCEIIPTGTAVQRLRSELPVRYTENSLGGDVVGSARFVQDKDGAWQPQGDVFHMGPDGNYLQALVWTEKLFGVDVTKCTYAPAGMPEARAQLLRSIAHRTVQAR